MAAIELAVSIDSTEERTEGGETFVVYRIVYREHTIWRRYSEFAALHKELAKDHPDAMRTLHARMPKKTLFNRDARLIEERRVLLENYLRNLLLNPELRASKHLRDFLEWQGKLETDHSKTLSLLGLSQEDVTGIVDMQRQKYTIDQEFDQYLRQVSSTEAELEQ